MAEANWGQTGIQWGLFAPQQQQGGGNAFSQAEDAQARREAAAEQRRQFDASHGLRQQESARQAQQFQQQFGLQQQQHQRQGDQFKQEFALRQGADSRQAETHRLDTRAKQEQFDEAGFNKMSAINDLVQSAKTPAEQAEVLRIGKQFGMNMDPYSSPNGYRIMQERMKRSVAEQEAKRQAGQAGIRKSDAEAAKDSAQGRLYDAQAGAADQQWAPHPANDALIFNKKTGEVRRAPEIAAEGQPGETKKFREARDKELGEARGKAIVDLPRVEDNAELALKTIDQIIAHPGRGKATGLLGSVTRIPGVGFMPGTDARGFEALLEQAKGKTFLEAFNSLKGGGQITEAEGAKATAALARLDRAQNERDFNDALKDLREVITLGTERARLSAGQGQQRQSGAPRPQQAPQGAPQPGAVVAHPSGQFRFKGGNPADPGSWEKVQ